MVRVAITINTSWNIYNFRLGLVKAFQEKGWEVLAIAPEDEYSPLLEEEGCRFIPIKMENKGSNPLRDLSLLHDLYRIYKKNNIDIVLQYTIKPNIYGTMAAEWAGVPVINNVSGLGTVFLHHNLVSVVARFLYKIAFRYPRKVFFQNRDDLQLFLDEKLVKKEVTGVLPGSGVNIEKFRPGQFRRNPAFTFLMISRLLFDKGLMEYAAAARQVKEKFPEAKFIVIGSLDPGPLGVPESTVKGWMAEGLLEIIFFRKDVRPFIDEADCVVLPSYREGTPKTLLEAAAMGKPLIATDVPGCREVVEDGQNGFLCQARDSADLAAAMVRMLSQTDEELRAQGRKSREMVLLKYDEKIVIREYLEAIGKIIGQT